MVKLNDVGQEVSKLQKLLSSLGYDLIVDGHFGAKTQRSVKSFQKKHGLISDGIAGHKTFAILKVVKKRKQYIELPNTSSVDFINDKNLLPDEQYNKYVTEKSQIFIHFTAGSGSARNVISYWDSNESKVSTAYVVDGHNGSVYQTFNPDFWGWHLGIKGSKGKLDKASVGIEICSYGPLKERNGKYYAWPAKWNTEVSKEKIYKLDKPFRGYKYFEAYSEAQLENLEKLLIYLIEKYNIQVQSSFDENWFEFNPELIKQVKPGIWTHTNVRKDKSDSYPDKRLLALLNKLAKKYNNE